ncbi:MAG: serine--glyoxylate aminotransferase, partial [Vulcanimicrobiaceae bacterium]
VRGWGLEILPRDPREFSNTLTPVVVPGGVDSDKVRAVILDRFDVSLGVGLGRVKGKIFRIGHLGSLNETMLAGVLCAVQMGLRLSGVDVTDGIGPALDYLANPVREPALA